MKNRFLPMLCVVLLCIISVSFPAPAAAQTTYYPISVEEYIEDGTPRIKKVYQLSINDDPSGIPRSDFEQFGYVYHLLDITQHTDEGVDAKDYTDTITQDSDTGELAEVLKQLDGQMEVTTEDGYTGLLVLDHTSIEITVKGYNTSTRNLSANRTYPNLSDADLSLIPKTVDESGRTLSLNDVQWASSYNADGSVSYTATASYTGTSTSRYATGYTVTANYRGRVSKTDCDMITYTAIFGGVEIQQEEPTPVPLPAIVIEEAPETDAVQEEPEPEATPEQTPDVETAAKPEKGLVWLPVGIAAVCAGGSAACYIMNYRKGGRSSK